MLYTEWVDKWMNVEDRLHLTYFYSGPMDADIVVVGQELAEGGKQPFAGAHDTLFAWLCYEEVAFSVGWTSVQEIPPQMLRSRRGVIGCGKRASKWLRYVVNGDVPLLAVTTPQYLFTRGTDSEIASVCNSVKLFTENQTEKGEGNG